MPRFIALVLAAMLLGGCAGRVPVPTPQGPQSAAVGLELKVRLHGFSTYRADAAFFVRRAEAGSRDEEQLVQSSYARAGRLYLLNAAPGEYRAVAVMFRSGAPGDQSLYFAYLPRALAEATRVQVRPGQLAYAGSYQLDAAHGLCAEQAEPEQLKYAQLIEPDTPKCGFFRPLLHRVASGDYLFIGGVAYPIGSQTFHYRGTLFDGTRSAEQAAAFREAAKGDLSGAGWTLAD